MAAILEIADCSGREAFSSKLVGVCKFSLTLTNQKLSPDSGLRFSLARYIKGIFYSSRGSLFLFLSYPRPSLSSIKDNHRYFYPPDDPGDYRFDVGNEHKLVADVDAQTLIKSVKFLKRGKVPGPNTIHSEVLRLGTTTSLFHHLARIFTPSIQLGYIPTAWKIATLHMLLKPDKLPSLTTSYWPFSLISSFMKLFERVIEQRLRSHLEHIGFINKHQSGFRKAKSTDDHLFRLSQSIMESFNRGEHVVAAFPDIIKAFDNFWHNGLRFKIFQLDLPTKMTRWLSDFLVGGLIQVNVNNFLSNQVNPKTGVTF